jgi:hypothetical protein
MAAGIPANGPANADEALVMLHAAADHLAGTDWQGLGGFSQGMALRSLGSVMAKLAAVHAGALGAFDACGGYGADGHPSARSWLQHQTRITRKAARELGQSKDRLAAHPVLWEAQAAGEISGTWASQFAAWTGRLPTEEVDAADKILLDAARAGLDLRPDIEKLAQAIYEAVKGREPSPDDPGDGFADRGVRMGTTIGGAGTLRGDLSAECAALLAKVFEAFGKSVGGDDFRSPEQRNHDALETAVRLALGVPDIPQANGMKTRGMAVMSIADLLEMDGASVLCDAWLTARAGEPGWFFGPAAQAAACSAQVSPMVTGTPDWDVLSDMAEVFLDAHGIGGHLSPAARLALERTLLAMSVRALSGPSGLAGFLRANILGRPFAGKSLILDVGDTDDIPDRIRRAVILRDKHCQWPGGCDRPASQCEPHHGRPRHEGGETSIENIDLYCFVHHHHYIHRLGWKIIKHPDGTREAISPAGRVISSHGRDAPGGPSPGNGSLSGAGSPDTG